MKLNKIAMYILGVLIIVGFFALLVILIFKPIPENNSEVLNLAIGSLLSSFSMVVGYFYGSSAGSAQKTELMNNNKIDKDNSL